MTSRAGMQIGIVGTFDVENYGDLLYPIIAKAELERRLGPIALHPFSYFAKSPPDWPFAVSSLAALPQAIANLDAMVVGGGDVIRFDKDVAPGYLPSTPEIHHPTGYWLTPALLALQHGCKVAWNAPGVHGQIPAWATPLMGLALQQSGYFAVRDENSRVALAPYANGREIEVVPDTAFGVARLVDRHRPSPAMATLRQSLALDRPYIIVQATPDLKAFLHLVRNHQERFASYSIVSLPAGPALGDDPDAFAGEPLIAAHMPFARDPLLMAELIAGAEAVVAKSLHLCITALAFDVRVFRLENTPIGDEDMLTGKYAVLRKYPNVHVFAWSKNLGPDGFLDALSHPDEGREIARALEALDRHWDRIASSFNAAKDSAASGSGSWLSLHDMPGILELAFEARDNHEKELLEQAAVAEHDQQLSAREKRESTIMEQTAKAQAANRDHDQQLSAREKRANKIVEQAARQAAKRKRDIMDESTQQTAKLEAAIAERDRQLKALSSAVTARDDFILALHNSTSWKLTAPLRWVGRRWAGNSNPKIVRLDKIRRHAMSKVPYEWAFVNELYSDQDAAALVSTYPRDHFKTVKGYDGEKGYEYESRALIHLGASSIAFADELSESWRRLAGDLLSYEYREAMSRLTGRNLFTAPMEAYICHFGPGAWLGPHLDLKAKILTHVFYFNDSWDPSEGGCLNILRSANEADSIAEVAPIVGNSSILIRADNSWHSVSRVTQSCRGSRRSMNVIFYHPGATSTMWPAGDNTQLHRYDPPET
jgi:hypothetical protein